MANPLQLNTSGAPLYLEIASGADFRYAMTFTVTDQPFDLTGCVLSGQIRKTYGSPAIAEFSFVVTDAAAGKAVMSLTAAQTAAIPVGSSNSSSTSKYVYSVQIAYGNGLIAPLFSGPLVMNPGATYA